MERWFGTLKGLEVRVRPIRHREERRVRAHLFVCLLAGYVQWHLRRAVASSLFDDETLEAARRTRDPVAPAKPRPAPGQKGTPAHRRRIDPAPPGYVARRACDALPQHLPGAVGPRGSDLLAPY